ncbi:MAG: AAA family ATPase [Tissierellia bacterium]|nr:AAA family ATPase [Tissierellia bacterium]
MPLPDPKGKQIEVLCLPEVGHYVILGTAGSGKTTLAIHRAANLADSVIDDGQRVLLVTFNKSLVTYLNSISDKMLTNVDVRNYHRFARGYLSNRGMLGWNDIVPSMDYNRENKKLTFIKQAIEQATAEVGANSTLSRAPEIFYEEICWIQKMGISSLDEYINVDRVGRAGTRITRENRKYFFAVYEKYLNIRAEYDYKYDWDDIASAVIEELEQDDEERYYKHIVIDEGQDLSPVMLRSLALAIPEDGSITFFGDVAQQIYGGRISWRSAGLNVKKGEIWEFDQNYRNSKEIAELAIAISSLPFFDKNVDLITPKFPTAEGPKPVLVEFQDEDKELEWVVSNAINLSENQTVGILVRTRQDVKRVKRLLNRNSVYYQELHGDMNSWDSSLGISVGTYHSAKGLEFYNVLLPLCSEDRIPDPDKIIALDNRDEALSEEAKLIYVAVTRAKRRLVLTHTGNPTEVIPKDDSLYQKAQR